MDISEIKRETRYKLESIIGSFDFIDEKVNEVKMQLFVEEKHVKDLISFLLILRQQLRDKKDFELADKIRTEVLKYGIEVKDTEDKKNE